MRPWVLFVLLRVGLLSCDTDLMVVRMLKETTSLVHPVVSCCCERITIDQQKIKLLISQNKINKSWSIYVRKAALYEIFSALPIYVASKCR